MNNTNLILSIILSIAIIIGWQYFYEKPRLNNLAQYQKEIIELKQTPQKNEEVKMLQVSQALEQTPRSEIRNANISGSINLVGARIDDIVLLKYNEEINQDQHVRLFAPSNTQKSYFAEVGWYSPDKTMQLPDSSTLWKISHASDNEKLLTWMNNSGVEFIIKICLDEHYMLAIDQTIKNGSQQVISVKPYALINRNYVSNATDSILHQGPIAVIDGELKEYSYSKLKDDGKKSFKNIAANWAGITDKYWLAAFIPNDKEENMVNFQYSSANSAQKFQVDILSDVETVSPGAEITNKNKLFAGAKEVKLLDQYAKKYDIKLFDRAIDFGWLYIITKPLFYTMSFFYEIFGNFGLSIMLVTVLLKACMFTLSTKAGRSMKRLKELQPEMERLKQKFADDKIRLNQEILSLYKKENVNPLSGCLPLLIQIPIFFAIYKVLYVTIEMRHAPFYGWISDLSSADPTCIVNLFGLLPFTPPSFLHIGVWPALMSISMFVQQQISGSPSMDPVQAQAMKLLPLIFLFTFASFPSGLLIYWTWSNLLSILQQMYVNKYVK